MQRLVSVFPDAEVLLALEPEELAIKLLPLLKEAQASQGMGMIHPLDFADNAGYEDMTRGISGYPREKVEEVKAAILEALTWLEGQGFLVPVANSNASNGWKVLSRRAMGFENAAEFEGHVLARRLHRDLLHETIAEDVWLNFIRGKYATAVFEAMRAVEVAVREAAGFSQGEHGVAMIRRAFHKENGPLTDASQEEAEREALMHLFAGAIGSYKNPHSHRFVPMDDSREAMEVVMLASHLLRIVDARRPNQA